MPSRIHKWRIVRGTADSVAERILADVPGVMTAPDAVAFRAGKTRVTALLPDAHVVVKWTRRLRTRAKLAALRAPTAAAMEFDLTAQALHAGIPTARPLFVAERRLGPIVTQQVIAFEHIPDTEPLDTFVDLRRGPNPAHRDARQVRWLARWGALLARAHAAGLAHRDATADNVLVPTACHEQGRMDGPLVLLDWGRSTRIAPDDVTARYDDACGAIANLHMLGVPAAGLLAFFRAWCPEDERHEAAHHIIAYLRQKIPRLVRRTWGNALSPRNRLTRKIGPLIALKRVTPEELATAESITTTAAACHEPGRMANAWRVSCVADRFRLPVRPALAIDQSANTLSLPRSQAVPTDRDAVELIRLLARFGLRITDTAAIVHAPDDPLTTRSAGLRIDDPRALELIAP